MGPPDSSQIFDLLRTLLVVVAGLWVLYQYRRRREGKEVVRMALAARAGSGPSGERGLFVRIHAANVSSVLLRRMEASLMLLAPAVLDHEVWRFDTLGNSDPLLPLAEEAEIERGMAAFATGVPKSLEPGECLESEVFVALPEPVPPLLALRLRMRSEANAFRPRALRWAVFAFVTVDRLDENFCPITCHGNDISGVHSPR